MKNKNWSLKIGGSGAESYVAELKRRYPDSRIEWLGFVDPRRFFEQIDVMVFSSIWAEPLGRSLIEAYAAGRTSIASCSGGIPEIATFGKTYATYDAEDVDELARQMDEAASNPIKWRDGGFASPEKSHLFSEATVTSKYLDVYRAIEASKNLRFRRNT